MTNYNFQEIEEKWQKRWEEQDFHLAPRDATSENKYYVLPQLPYPSGEGLHVGHTSVYTPCDIYARFKRMQGKKVLQVIGWDSFGLPAENFAIKHNVHPKVRTEETINNFEQQIRRLGCALDWSRAVAAHRPDYYKWTQWLFLLLFKRGLAYRKKQLVNWCESCKTVLATEQTIPRGEDGVRTCERCETVVVQRELEQWFLKTTEYAERLINDLDKVDWPAESIKRQRDWIGRSEGVTLTYSVQGSDKTITVFTTRPDTCFGVTFLALAPDGPFIRENLGLCPNRTEVEKYLREVSFKTELERQSDRRKTGVFTGFDVSDPFTQRRLPVYVADFVLGSVGTGALMGVPGHDRRDFEFAQEMGLPVTRVVVGKDGDTSPIIRLEQVQEEEGVMIGSGFLDGLDIKEATEKALVYIEEKGWGKRTVTYKLRDWSVSRQRFWGAPIPIVYDPKGSPHPVADEDLPVLLPEDVDFKPTGESPLKDSQEFQRGVEEKYGTGWRREIDTLDTFVDSSWYYYRYLDSHNEHEFASPQSLKAWMPVDFYLGGREHVNGHLLYSRFITKVLFDAGFVSFDEPFLKHRHQGTIWGPDGRIMSKRYGNVINPTDVIAEYGADCLRLYQQFLGPLEASKPWNVEGIKGVQRFVERVYRMGGKDFPEGEINTTTRRLIFEVTQDMEELRLNVVIAKLMTVLNEYEKTAPSKQSWQSFLQLLSPFAPHLTEELWEMLGEKMSIHLTKWPKGQEVVDEVVTVAVQVNGKLRAMLSLPKDEVADETLLQDKAREALGSRLSVEPLRTIVVKGKLVNFVVQE